MNEQQHTLHQEQLTAIVSSNNRLLCDLEFVDLLADPDYLLTILPFLKEKAFINYLNYLSYLRHPDYINFVQFPHSLQVLSLLQLPQWRVALMLPANGPNLVPVRQLLVDQMSLMMKSPLRSADDLYAEYEAQLKNQSENADD